MKISTKPFKKIVRCRCIRAVYGTLLIVALGGILFEIVKNFFPDISQAGVNVLVAVASGSYVSSIFHT